MCVLCTQVSWIRKRDLHILTAGILTYTSDQRFQVIRPDKSDNWTLQIKFPQIRDSGIYECQVNTEPKMSLPFRLNVVEAKARILGPSDLHVKAGSSITLTCLISQGPHDLGTVFWYKGENILETASVRTHISDIVDYTSRVTIELCGLNKLAE
uniref:Zwei Ig domain protein zig-8-like n=1 Tax=Diabrotica virgifera virgifera TaxID=50390 RepID=A0A6P7GHF6_DIAVI